MNQRKAGTILSYINIIVNTIINLSYVPLLLFYIGQEEYGLYKLLGSFVAYFGLMDFGLNSAVVRFYTKYLALGDHRKMENLLGIASYFYSVIITAILIASCIVYYFIDDIFGSALLISELEEARLIFIVLTLNLVVSFGGQIFTAAIISHERFFLMKLVALLTTLLKPIFVVWLISIYPKAIMVVLTQTFFNILIIAIYVFYAIRNLNVRIHYYGWDEAMFQEIKKLAGSVFIVFLVDQIFWQTNQVILGIYAGTAVVAVYAIASQIYMNYCFFAMIIPDMFSPKITRMVTMKVSIKELSDIFIKIGRLQYLLAGLLLCSFFIFGKEFIELWAGKNFQDAYWITLIIICPFTIDLIQNLGLSILKAQNRYGFRAFVYFCVGTLNLLLVVIVAKDYGGIGCATVTGSMMFIGNGFVMNYYYWKYIGLDIKNFWKNIAYISISLLLSLAIGEGINFALNCEKNIVLFMLKIIIFTVLYIAVMYKFAMNNYERELAESCLKKAMIWK